MTDKLQLDPKTSALLIMDFQTAIVDGPRFTAATAKESLLARTASLIEAARKAGMKVIYIVVGFRPGYPEVSPRNQSFSAIRESGRFAAGSAGTRGSFCRRAQAGRRRRHQAPGGRLLRDATWT